MVELGADKEASTANGARPLHSAAFEGHVETASPLAELGADVNSQDDDGDTPLHMAAIEGHVSAVKTLVELGADIGGGETPLQVSIRRGHHQVAQVLRELDRELERSARTRRKEAATKKPTQQASERANLMANLRVRRSWGPRASTLTALPASRRAYRATHAGALVERLNISIRVRVFKRGHRAPWRSASRGCASSAAT